jgi:hypothetical protein
MRSGLFQTPCTIPGPALTLLRGLLFAFTLGAQDTPPTLVLGIAGGWEPAEAPWTITRRIGLHLELQQFPNTHFESIGNHHLDQAKTLITQTVDLNHDGTLSTEERAKARIILYGQSLGGAASVNLCRWLNKQKIPVRLNVQIDSVGLRDGKIPRNVKEAANLYQRDFGPIRGQSKIKPEDPKLTRILGNWRYTYPRNKLIDTSDWPIAHRLIVNPHLKMEFDPEVSGKVEELIATALRNW